jgi:serine/threonine protein kinase
MVTCVACVASIKFFKKKLTIYLIINLQSNILIDDQIRVRLMDFGLSVFADKTGAFDGTSEVGAQAWMAPELLDPDKMGLDSFQRTYASDIYAFACICIEVNPVTP